MSRARAFLLSLLLPPLLFSPSLLSRAPKSAASPPRLAMILEAGRPALGVFSGPKTPDQGALAAGIRGTDFVFYSLEQPPFDLDTMSAYLAAMRAAEHQGGRPARPFVLRIPPVGDDPEVARDRVAQALASGVDSIVFPHVRTAAEAALAVAAVQSDSDARWQPMSLLIVEDKEGVKNARQIAATENVGVVFAGPGDLSQAYGGDMAAVEKAIQTVLSACLDLAVPCGVTAGSDDIARRLAEGFRVIIVTDNAALIPGRQQVRHLAVERDLATANPIEALDSVWIEELTWMEVRDAIQGGKRTAIIATGGIEPSGPYLATGKHNVVLQAACEMLARELGDALCAPILKLVPEGSIEPPSGHMLYPGTLSLSRDTFERVLDDVASSLHAHGFEHVVLIGDSGGNQAGMKAVAERLSDRWGANRAHYIADFYRYDELIEWMGDELGILEPLDQGLHDDFVMTALMMAVDPESVRHEQRLRAGLASINGISIADREATATIGQKLLQRRVDETAAAIRRAVASSDR